MENELYLCFARNVGDDVNGNHMYEFFFTNNPDEFFGEDFEYTPACLVNELVPFERAYQKIMLVETNIKFKLAQESCCYSMQDCFDGIHPVAFEDLTGLEEYPTDGRLVLHFDLPYEEVERLLAAKNILMQEKKVGE